MTIIQTTLSVLELEDILRHNNPGLILIKFGASFCKPCQVIKEDVYHFFSQLPDTVLCYDIDIEENEELFRFYKSKRLVTSIPTIIAYYRENKEIGPNDSVSGVHIHDFFNRCTSYLRLL